VGGGRGNGKKGNQRKKRRGGKGGEGGLSFNISRKNGIGEYRVQPKVHILNSVHPVIKTEYINMQNSIK
jgi:hypothetical protein